MQRFVIVAAVVVVLGGVATLVYGLATRTELVVQPIAFNHAIHVGEADMQCVDCHTGAETEVSPGLPGKAICYDCHDIDDEEGSHPEKDKLFAFDESDADIPWGRVARTVPDVFFSHRRHAGPGKIDCLECHEGQRDLTAPPKRGSLVVVMNDCIDCHEEVGASTDCLACHR